MNLHAVLVQTEIVTIYMVWAALNCNYDSEIYQQQEPGAGRFWSMQKAFTAIIAFFLASNLSGESIVGLTKGSEMNMSTIECERR